MNHPFSKPLYWLLVALGLTLLILILHGEDNQSSPPVCDSTYCLESDSKEITFAPNEEKGFSFLVTNSRGRIIKDFKEAHTELMHILIVRHDLSYFEHVHPRFDKSSGIFTLDKLSFPKNGVYRMYANFLVNRDDGMSVIFEDIRVGEDLSEHTPLEKENRAKVFDGTLVLLTSSPETLTAKEDTVLTFDISKNDVPLTDLEQYLGALGHAVIIKEETLDFLHVHPLDSLKEQDGRVPFHVMFPSVGRYKIFAQFQREGKVFTTDFVVNVAENAQHNSSNEHNNHRNQ